MKCGFVAVLGVGLLAGGLRSWAAEDGAALYKSKCAGCHGAKGEGKPAMKAPALTETKRDASQVADFVMKGDTARKAPHKKHISGLTADHAKAVAEYVKTLK
jgi:mono/diheme cytochrome c family protein